VSGRGPIAARSLAILAAAAGLLAAIIIVSRIRWPQLPPPATDLRRDAGGAAGPRTVADRVAEHGTAVRERLGPSFARAGISWPPARVVLAAIKSERVLYAYAAAAGGDLAFLRSYPILGASGVLGPKLREGDRQVPEGVYPIESLNPNSRYHLSLRIGYPSEFDREMARREGRTDLGGDIMIHGGSASIGCLAMGDGAAEDLFVLVAAAGAENARAVLSPVDFRKDPAPAGLPREPAWIEGVYDGVRAELERLPLPGPDGEGR
jgi:hypothetical protein